MNIFCVFGGKMHKKSHEKIKDYFISMGKKHRWLLPLAAIGLAITMLITNFCKYCRRSVKRFACISFVICFFFFGNSFAFANLIFDNGFVSSNESEGELIAASTSDINLATEEDVLIDESDSENLEENATIPESGEVLNDDLIYLDDMLDDIETPEESTPEELTEIQETVISNTQIPVYDEDDWKLVLINKQHPIPDDYEFTLGQLSGNMQCDERIVNDLLLMVKAAKDDGVSLVICSPYRDLERQEMLFNRKINSYMNKGYSYMDAYKLSSQAVTIPGSSEHQVGLAIDIVTTDYTYLDEGFADTDAGKWLYENCQDYGFILRYPKDKEYITSIEYEPWHFRYVGKDAASVIMENDICLEEFWEKYL